MKYGIGKYVSVKLPVGGYDEFFFAADALLLHPDRNRLSAQIDVIVLLAESPELVVRGAGEFHSRRAGIRVRLLDRYRHREVAFARLGESTAPEKIPRRLSATPSESITKSRLAAFASFFFET